MHRFIAAEKANHSVSTLCRVLEVSRSGWSGAIGTRASPILWVADTYVRTWEGWLYLAAVIDCFSRKVVGWSIAEDLRAEGEERLGDGVVERWVQAASFDAESRRLSNSSLSRRS